MASEARLTVCEVRLEVNIFNLMLEFEVALSILKLSEDFHCSISCTYSNLLSDSYPSIRSARKPVRGYWKTGESGIK